MDNTYAEDEKLYRAVFPIGRFPNFWRENGKLSSAAFKDKKGLSVERGNNRDDKNVVIEMKQYFQGSIVYITVSDCNEVNAIIKYLPTKRSVYHSEIHSSMERVLLTPSQCKMLAEKAIIVFAE